MFTSLSVLAMLAYKINCGRNSKLNANLLKNKTVFSSSYNPYKTMIKKQNCLQFFYHMTTNILRLFELNNLTGNL